MPLYLGPLGRLRELRAPKPFEPTQDGVDPHVAMSGARTIDYAGTRRRTFPFEWAILGDRDRNYLEALRDRHVPGPLRFVLPGWRRNRLSRQAASLGYGGRDLYGVTVTAGNTAPSSEWPEAADPAGLSLAWSGWAVSAALRLDRDHPAPVLTGETITGSMWVRASAGCTVRLAADWRTATGYTAQTLGATTNLTAAMWARLTVTAAQPSGALGVSLALIPTATSGPNVVLAVAAAQVEAAATATEWEPGGGAPVVSVDTLPYTAQWHGLTTEPTLTLLEL